MILEMQKDERQVALRGCHERRPLVVREAPIFGQGRRRALIDRRNGLRSLPRRVHRKVGSFDDEVQVILPCTENSVRRSVYLLRASRNAAAMARKVARDRRPERPSTVAT